MADKDENKLIDLNFEGTKYRTQTTSKFASRESWKPEDPNKIFAVIPGTVLKLTVKEGQRVSKGRCLYVLEAMKMKNKILAIHPGEVKKIFVAEGQKVSKNELVMELKDLAPPTKGSKSFYRSKA